MTSSVVDLRSDTVTRPTPAMREAMFAAAVGDDVYGEDPAVNALEAEVATLLGHEAGLFCGSGSLANMLGVRVVVPEGKELLCEATAHVVRAEMGGHALLGGVTTRTWTAPRGRLEAEVPLGMAVPQGGPYLVSTGAIAVENTHNFGGGTVSSVEQMRTLAAGARAEGIAVHLDGARLWNAHVASCVPLAEYGACADTVSVCLSKGLGAPVGSVLVSTAERIARARVLRKRYGGGMRQVGMLAAAGSHALAHHVARLAADHEHARVLAEAVADVRPDLVDLDGVETNIVVLDAGPTGRPAADLAASLAERGVLVSALGPRTLRLVTHLDVDPADVDRAASELRAVLRDVPTA